MSNGVLHLEHWGLEVLVVLMVGSGGVLIQVDHLLFDVVVAVVVGEVVAIVVSVSR